jgi:hypothetical protein
MPSARSLIDSHAGFDLANEKSPSSLTTADLDAVFRVDYTGDSGLRDSMHVGQKNGVHQYRVLCDLTDTDSNVWCITDMFVKTDAQGQYRADYSGSPKDEGTEAEMRKEFNSLRPPRQKVDPSTPPRANPSGGNNPLAGMNPQSARRHSGRQFSGDVGGSSSNYR